jgi:lycopene beta-cyclase
MSSNNFDYIISGMGCAGLSLAVQMSNAGLTRGKRILLVDRERKERNDRTWCFWETGPGPFEDIVFRRWDHAWFHSNRFSKLLDLAPYSYKMIRGIDFFSYCLQEVQKDPAFTILHADVQSVGTDEQGGFCVADGKHYRARCVFNSVLFHEPKVGGDEHYLLQHFKGWIIETDQPFFRISEATLMDFRPNQCHGTTFVYVMPFSPTEALVEYTLFTSALLEQKDYDKGLEEYLRNTLGLHAWDVKDEEFGIIPMTNHRFRRREGALLNIGTAGGRTKASSGYTFRFIQKDTAAIVASLVRSGEPFGAMHGYSRFDWYDSVLLNILANSILPGDEVFTDLFQFNEPDRILRFLDNETSLTSEFKILTSLPQWPFMKAGITEAVRAIKRTF